MGYNQVLSATIDFSSKYTWFAIVKSIAQKVDTFPQFTFRLQFMFGYNSLVHDPGLDKVKLTFTYLKYTGMRILITETMITFIVPVKYTSVLNNISIT